MSELTNLQQQSLAKKRDEYDKKVKTHKDMSAATIVIMVLFEKPDKWFFTWELMGLTKWGFLSHATHATLRVLEQKGRITKDYIGKYVVYTAKSLENIQKIDKLF